MVQLGRLTQREIIPIYCHRAKVKACGEQCGDMERDSFPKTEVPEKTSSKRSSDLSENDWIQCSQAKNWVSNPAPSNFIDWFFVLKMSFCSHHKPIVFVGSGVNYTDLNCKLSLAVMR